MGSRGMRGCNSIFTTKSMFGHQSGYTHQTHTGPDAPELLHQNDIPKMVAPRWCYQNGCTRMIWPKWLHQRWYYQNGCTQMVLSEWLHRDGFAIVHYSSPKWLHYRFHSSKTSAQSVNWRHTTYNSCHVGRRGDGVPEEKGVGWAQRGWFIRIVIHIYLYKLFQVYPYLEF